MSHAEIERIRPLVADLVMIGFFRLSGIVTTLSHSELLDVADAAADGCLTGLADGWFVTNWEDTLASQTLERVAGVVSEPVSCADVVSALMKAIGYGPAEAPLEVRRQRAAMWVEAFESLPTKAVLAELANIVGARLVADKGVDMMDFENVYHPIPPTEKELDVLYALEESPYGAMQLSRLCRRIPGSPSRTKTYGIIEPMPFILKDHLKAARIIGYEGHPEGFIPEKADFFHGLCWNADGTRALLELSANDECIQSNSCNIPAEARERIEGVYADVHCGIQIRCDRGHGPDKRKITGLPRVVRKLFRNYVAKDRLYVLLDMQTGEARVDVISLHGADKLASIVRMLHEGIRRGDLCGMFDGEMEAAA